MGIMVLHHNSRSKKTDTYLINHQIAQPEWDYLMKIKFVKDCVYVQNKTRF
jgi:hypothetical protein